jgi:hypothetical protein
MADMSRRMKGKYGDVISKTMNLSSLDRVNTILAKAERQFLFAEGLPGRPWHKHAVLLPVFIPPTRRCFLPGCRKAQTRTIVKRLDASEKR